MYTFNSYHSLPQPEYPSVINSNDFKSIFSDCADFESRDIAWALDEDRLLYVCWIDGIVSGKDVSQDIIRPMTDIFRAGHFQSEQEIFDAILTGAVYSCSVSSCEDTDTVLSMLTHGHCALIFNSLKKAICFEVKTASLRAVSEPSLEKSVKGAKDSFVEALRVNTSLVRRRIASPKLKVIESTVGRKSRTKVSLMFIEGIASPAVVSACAKRLDELDIDSLIATGNLEEYIVDCPLSPFPQLLHTERPDRFSQYLLEGRIGLITDGIPIGLVLPVTFADFMKVTGDSSNSYIIVSALIILRWMSLLISVFLPAIYVSVAMYHQEMLPTRLLLSIIDAKQNVPFSTALEVVGMLMSFELLQEAGLRLPNPIGDTVSIIGALIVGQSAVEAQVVSPIAIIVVALAGIAGYTLPSQDLGAAVRFTRFIMVIVSVFAGLFGVGVVSCILLVHLASIDSFGVNYTAPLSDGKPFALLRLLLRPPKSMVKFRNPIFGSFDRRKQK